MDFAAPKIGGAVKAMLLTHLQFDRKFKTL